MNNKEPYKLYRSIYEIIHPSISRKNISEYKIILKDDLSSVQVFYPSKEIELNEVLIYIHGKDIELSYYSSLAIKTKQVVIVIDYRKDKINTLSKTVNYIINELNSDKLNIKNISIMGDFDGASIILDKLSNFSLKKVLLSPTVTDLNSYNLSNVMVISNNEKQTNINNNIIVIRDSIYDFIHNIDVISNEKIYYLIINYLNGVDLNDSKEKN
ncbi:MAG: hypothetical protein Q4E39_04600 [bacterium]|nr:hypothetical protein [bacterium]